ncbi:MAG TPA: PilZ domain-containing protein [Bryobacteraceae bacterium]|nr:PilZ domain-containing protein [Bryobacteraceae bacterium]
MSSWRSNVKQRADSRRHPRFPIEGPLRVLWHDANGRERVSNAKLVNVSVAGLKLRVDEPIPVRALLLCNDQRLGIRGSGAVRYCIMTRGKYEIGVEFNGGTGWHEPDPAAAPDPAASESGG